MTEIVKGCHNRHDLSVKGVKVLSKHGSRESPCLQGFRGFIDTFDRNDSIFLKV